MEEYMSSTQSSTCQYSLTYDKYFRMFQNAGIRYDKTLKHKPSTTSRGVYQHEVEDDPSTHQCIFEILVILTNMVFHSILLYKDFS